MPDQGAYTAEELAAAAQVSLRTVRYYVQEEIIDPPFGRGPGKHFGERHLVQLRRARLLQDAGFDLETIRDRSGGKLQLDQSFSDFVRMREFWTRQLGQLPELKTAAEGRGKARPKTAEDVRIPITDGVELAVRKDVKFPSPKALVQLAFAVRKAFEDAQ